MARRTLLDFFDDLAALDGTFVVHDDGYRTWSFSYKEIANGARQFAARLREARIERDQKVVVWSENRPEWLVVLWGCMLEGVILVPIDYRSSPELMLRIADIVDAKAIVVGEVVPSFERATRVTPEMSVANVDNVTFLVRVCEPPASTVPDGPSASSGTAPS